MNSDKTSRNIVPKGFKVIDWSAVNSNFDYGGGKFDKASEWLLDNRGVVNYVYDPYNRDDDHNKNALIQSEACDSTTCCNVLNVIKDEADRLHIIRELKRSNTKVIYITVYEKDKTGIGKPTRDGWQNNMKTKDYMPEIKKVYPQATLKAGLITIHLYNNLEYNTITSKCRYMALYELFV